MNLRNADLGETFKRIRYYLEAGYRHYAPRQAYLQKTDRLFRSLLQDGVPDALAERVNYLNKLHPATPLDLPTTLDRVDRGRSRYFHDLQETLKYFPAALRINYLFVDNTTVPAIPTLLKSRPVGEDNANAVLLNLDRLRHYRLVDDNQSWARKSAKAVWRGRLHNDARRALVRQYQDNPLCDIGHIGSEEKTDLPLKRFLTQKEQLGFRYVISVEGNDVATNLKWIMASNSVCLMTRPKYETWFMEGRLKPDYHYILLKDDYSDLEEKIDALEADPKWAQWIVSNANAHVRTFSDRSAERIVSLLVGQKYFEATGQLPPSAFSSLFFPETIA